MPHLVAERPVRPSRSKTRAGLAALQQQTRSQRAAADAVAEYVLDVLATSPGNRSSIQQIVVRAGEAGHARRRVTDAIYNLKALGRVGLDVTSSTVVLRTRR